MLRRRLIKVFPIIGLIPVLSSFSVASGTAFNSPTSLHSDIGQFAFESMKIRDIKQILKPFFSNHSLDFNAIESHIINQEKHGQLIEVNGWWLTEVETAVIAYQYALQRGLI